MNTSQIATLIEKLDKQGFVPRMARNDIYYDEPRFFSYSTGLKITRKHTDGNLGTLKDGVNGSGTSFFSSHDALSKSIYEAMERFCEYTYKKKSIRRSIYKKNTGTFMDVTAFSKDSAIKNKKIAWLKGLDLTHGKSCFIPAGLIYMNYKKTKDEPNFDYPNISTGSAGGSTLEHAILNGIYEFIERDGIMSIYLNKITPPIIDLSFFKDTKIDQIVSKFKRYNIELYVLDITTDVGIPSFLAVAIDQKGFPSVSLGAKSGLKIKDAIIGAILESLMIRTYTKNMLKSGSITPDLQVGKTVFADRARHWILPETYENIKFLIKGPKKKYKSDKFAGTHKEELKRVLKIIKERGLSVYGYETTLKEFKDLGFFAYQVIIPTLQPLYLQEKEKSKSVNVDRLKQVAEYFKKPYKEVNPVPHPFL